MIDPRLVADEPDRVKANLSRRNQPDLHAVVDQVVALSERRSALLVEQGDLRNQRNVLSREIGDLMKRGDRDEAEARKAVVTAGNERIAAIETELALVETERDQLLMVLPNIVDETVPDGTSETDNVVVRAWGEPPAFDFEPQSHVEVGTRLGILDFERAAKLSGARFAVLRGQGARLERALISFFLDIATQEHGYTEVLTPYIVHRRILEGTGQLPKFEADLFKLEGELNGSDAFLIPTAEVPVTNLHRDEIVDAEDLPLQYASFTPCFRAEAGSAGRDVRGMIRVHQFHKVELVWITAPEHSARAHERLVGHAETLLQRLGLAYRVSLLCSGDLSFAAQRCYDLEVWLPSQGAYREISSISNFGDFQARRMMLRCREPAEGGKKGRTRFAHTLNGSGLAVGRTLVALLENGQRADGSVELPAVLGPYLGGDLVLRPPDAG
jgi:seryl-tRNA synthetase